MIFHVFISGWKLSPGDFDLCKSEVVVFRCLLCVSFSVCLLFPMDFGELHAGSVLQVTSALNCSQKCMFTQISHICHLGRACTDICLCVFKVAMLERKGKGVKERKRYGKIERHLHHCLKCEVSILLTLIIKLRRIIIIHSFSF